MCPMSGTPWKAGRGWELLSQDEGSWLLGAVSALQTSSIQAGLKQHASVLLWLDVISEIWYLLSQIANTVFEDSKSTATVRAVSMNGNCKIQTDSTEQCVLFLVWNKEEWMLIHIQTKTNDSCRNWKTVLTVPCVSLGDVSSSLSTWTWRTSPATGSICCLNIPKPWLTKWKGGRATARSLLGNWKQNCRLLWFPLWLKLITVEIWRSVLTDFLLSQAYLSQ